MREFRRSWQVYDHGMLSAAVGSAHSSAGARETRRAPASIGALQVEFYGANCVGGNFQFA
jgi:hypothetical protein